MTFLCSSYCVACTVTRLWTSLSLLSICVQSAFKSLTIFFNTHNGSDDLGGLPGILGFAEYLCESCLALMAAGESHCQVRHFTSVGSLRHDFISCCLWVVTLNLPKGNHILWILVLPRRQIGFYKWIKYMCYALIEDGICLVAVGYNASFAL